MGHETIPLRIDSQQTSKETTRRILAAGVRDIRTVERGITGSRSAPTYVDWRTKGASPSYVLSQLPSAREVAEVETGTIFYRLGDEFLSEEALMLISQRHPNPEVREQAIALLEEIKNDPMKDKYNFLSQPK